ncbi:nuclease A inhibitor family protein [Calothrix sp. PCC 6303]|uniref:nuclease A inhibitor family protein n=1 Tax=Calothrix sp. PCC 6303 TaxID=1170562 RepID=UPI0002A051E0|nr:nuclease A inhibitor family protein [Calothrix sp. PCC 6303]AFZ02767.1 hypothetical protein Cal6303_3850 [Calothrix sp. PCC 6303]
MIKLSNAELIAQLQSVTQDLSFVSESDYPFDIFVHEVSTQGELTVEKLLEAGNCLNLVDRDDVLEKVREIAPETTQIYREIIDLIESTASKLEIYQIKINDESGEYEAFQIFIIQTENGDWLGFAPKIEAEPSSRRSEKIQITDNTQISPSAIELKSKLELLLSQLKFIVTEYYEPNQIKQGFILEIAATKSDVIYKLLDSLGFLKVCNFKKFSDYLDFDEKDYLNNPEFLEQIRQIHQQYQSLDNFLESNLSNLREYVLGGMAVYYLYNIGQTQEGDWVGIATTAIWT